MKLQESIRKFILSDWVVASLLFSFFLIMKGYKYGWDDQDLEIPLLKSLINPTLYAADYYVQSLKANFPSFFFKALAHFISVKQIPTAYFILFLISRYFFFFWIYKIWLLISKNRFYALTCTFLVTTLGTIPEMTYRTLSHQEVALAFVFAGIYLFFKERFILASIILGFAANIHSLYSLYPFVFMGIYLVLEYKRIPFKTILKSFFGFVFFALPVIILTLQKRFTPELNVDPESTKLFSWFNIYKYAAQPNFLFDGWTFKRLFAQGLSGILFVQKYVFMLALFVFNIALNEDFKKDKKSLTIVITVFFLLAISYIFTYIKPSRFILDINLVRTEQFAFFILSGFTALFLIKLIDQQKHYISYLAAVTLGSFIMNRMIRVIVLACMFFFLFLYNSLKEKKNRPIHLTNICLSLGLLFFLGLLGFVLLHLTSFGYVSLLIVIGEVSLVYLAFYFTRNKKFSFLVRRLWVIIPMITVILYGAFNYYKNSNMEKKAETGFWKLQRDWEDMQRFVRDNTPKDALLLVPYDMEMGGFRIFSERSVVVEARDWGIAGFDYGAAIECFKRMRDIEPFKVRQEKPLNLLALKQVILKYKIDYVVFMKYYAPKKGEEPFELIYSNDRYVLAKVLLPTRK